MNILIIEDEPAALACFNKDFEEKEEPVRLIACLNSVKASVDWLIRNPAPDLILMDICLPDGPCSEIFRDCMVSCPVILMTHDLGIVNEFPEYNSMGYLLKPLNPEKLLGTVRKYQLLRSHFAGNETASGRLEHPATRKKSRILVKMGTEYRTVKMEDIACFFTEGKLVFVVDRDNRKMLAEKNNLCDLEAELDQNLFYRVNRKFIINANFIKRFMPVYRNRLSVELTLPVKEEIIISQGNVPDFKKWIKEESLES